MKYLFIRGRNRLMSELFRHLSCKHESRVNDVFFFLNRLIVVEFTEYILFRILAHRL